MVAKNAQMHKMAHAEQHRSFVENIRLRADDARQQCKRSATIGDLEHAFGVLVGLQWAALGYHEYAPSRPKTTAAEWIAKCGVASDDINPVVGDARARLVAANNQVERQP